MRLLSCSDWFSHVAMRLLGCSDWFSRVAMRLLRCSDWLLTLSKRPNLSFCDVARMVVVTIDMYKYFYEINTSIKNAQM